MASIMIATLYSHLPIIVSLTRFPTNKLILLIDNVPNDIQTQAVNDIKNRFADAIDIECIKTSVYKITEICEIVVRVIDSLPATDCITLNISAARKPKALALMYAGYARARRIKNIIYITKEDKETILLPKMSFSMNDSEKKILTYFVQYPNCTNMSLCYRSQGMSKTMFYKCMDRLKEKGLVGDDDKITMAGRISIL